MKLKKLNFGDVDAKNEILKQKRSGERDFFDSFLSPKSIDVDDYLNGSKYFILGLKGTGKTALLRYLHDKVIQSNNISEFILFKSHVTEEDRQNLSTGAGFEIISTENVSKFTQDFKESWKWLIYQKIASKLSSENISGSSEEKLYKLTGVSENKFTSALGSLFSKISSGNVSLSGEAMGVAVKLGIEVQQSNSSNTASLSMINRACAGLLNEISFKKPVYFFFDELELFYSTTEIFDRDRRIIRDLIYSISQINADSAEAGRGLYLVSSLRTEVLHSILELGHEIGRDIDDFGGRLDWSDQKAGPDHPLLSLIAKKISVSADIPVNNVWKELFPEKINNQLYYNYILNFSYYRPRDIVRLLRVAREYDLNAPMFTTAHFDQKSLEYSKQTWLEVTEELLASYSANQISALQRFFLGFDTIFFKEDLVQRIETRYQGDKEVIDLFEKRGIDNLLSDLYRIGVIGNDFIANKRRRNRWIFRGNTTLNHSERMTLHKSLWKHLTLTPGRASLY